MNYLNFLARGVCDIAPGTRHPELNGPNLPASPIEYRQHLPDIPEGQLASARRYHKQSEIQLTHSDSGLPIKQLEGQNRGVLQGRLEGVAGQAHWQLGLAGQAGAAGQVLDRQLGGWDERGCAGEEF